MAPTGGWLWLDDQPLTAWFGREFARHVAYLPQQLPAAQSLTMQVLQHPSASRPIAVVQ